MNLKPIALPRLEHVESAVADIMRTAANPQAELNNMLRRREVLEDELGLLHAEIERHALEDTCGLKADSQHVEKYDGTLGVTREFVEHYETPVGQLQWVNDLHQRFNGPGKAPGDVAGVRWGSGGLIDENLFLTAGHCFAQCGEGWQRPQRNGITIKPEEIALLMQVNFNYQMDGSTENTVRPGISFPIEKLVEYRLGGLDFAVVQLGVNQNGQTANELFGTLRLAENDITEVGKMLCLIQHPNRRPKVIEAGPMLHNISGQIAYNSLDTLNGSSGALVLSPAGEVVGVHTHGGCSGIGGFNCGVAIGAIRNVSSVLV